MKDESSATELAALLSRYDERKDDFWTASVGRRTEGSITIDAAHTLSEGVYSRWLIISDGLRGKGAGSQLVNTAMDFCRSHGYKMVYLWTFEGLNAARHLYEKNGFRLVAQHKGNQWGREVNEQRFELQL